MSRQLCMFMSLVLAGSWFGNCYAQGTDFKWSVTTANSFIAKYPNPDSIHWIGQSTILAGKPDIRCLRWKKCGVQPAT